MALVEAPTILPPTLPPIPKPISSRRPPLLQVLLGVLILVFVVIQLLSVGTLAGENECLLVQRLERDRIVQEVAESGGSALDVQVRILALPIVNCS